LLSYYVYDLILKTVQDGGPSYDAASRFLKGDCTILVPQTTEATTEQTTEVTTEQTTTEATTVQTTEVTTVQTTTEDATTTQTTSDVTTEPVTIANITDGLNGKPAVCFLPFQATMRCKNLQLNLFHAIRKPHR